jgi:hypothetical protein
MWKRKRNTRRYSWDYCAVLGISSETVNRDRKIVRAWLMREMKNARPAILN